MIPSRVSSKQSNFLSVRTETNRNSICFGCFSVCCAKPKTLFSVCFGLFRCFGPVLKQPKQTELCRNKPKKSQKNVLYYRVLKTVNFFSRFEPKQTGNKFVLVVFRFAFSQKQKKIIGLFRCFGPVSKQPKQTELMVWGIKKVDFLTNLLLFRSKQPKQTSCFG